MLFFRRQVINLSMLSAMSIVGAIECTSETTTSCEINGDTNLEAVSILNSNSTYGEVVTILADNANIKLSGEIRNEYLTSFNSIDPLGVNLDGASNNTIIMDANITTLGYLGVGIQLNNSSDNNIIYQNGNILTLASVAPNGGELHHAHGIQFKSSSDNTLYINGVINTEASLHNAWGLIIEGGSSNNKVIINNSILSEAHAVGLNGSSGNEVDIYALISAEHSDYEAIHVAGAAQNNTITLHRGALIRGNFYNVHASNVLKMNYGPSGSYHFATEDDEDGYTPFTMVDDYKPVVEGSIASMGVGEIDDEGRRIYELFSPLRTIANTRQHLNYAGLLDAGIWGYGFANTVDDEREFHEVSKTANGIIGGYSTYSGNSVVDFVMSAEQSEASFGYQLNDETLKTTSIIGGGFFPRVTKLGKVSFRALAGYSFHEINRNVLYSEDDYTADTSKSVLGDYTSTYALVGSDWLAQHNSEYVSPDFQVGAEIIRGFVSGYRSTEYYQTEYRAISQLHMHAQIGVSYKTFLENMWLRTYADLAYRNTLDKDMLKYTIETENVQYQVEENDDTYYTVGLDAEAMMGSHRVTLGAAYRVIDHDEIENSAWHFHAGFAKNITV